MSGMNHEMRRKHVTRGGAPVSSILCCSRSSFKRCTHSDTPIVFVVWRAGMKVRAEYSPTNSIRCRDREVGSR